MPLFRKLGRNKDKDGQDSKSSTSSTKSPTSPKFPAPIGLSEIKRNPDYLEQCAGCSNVDTLIRRNNQNVGAALKNKSQCLLHQSFEELEDCAHRCQTCRVFRQSLILDQITFDEVRDLQKTPGEVLVHWKDTADEHGIAKHSLEIELTGPPSRSALVNCSTQGNVEHLALVSEALDSAVMEQAKQWLDTCVNTHIGQCDNLAWSGEKPKLLVEIVSPGSVRLCDKRVGDYIALSYCWGNMALLSKAEQDEVERGKTKTTNLDRRRREFSMDELPSTVRDALHISRALGFRYAWIDTLCIVQDNPEGVADMYKIYSNAVLTLCSCATTRATTRLIGKREAWAFRTEPCRLGGLWLTVPDMSLSTLRGRSPLAGRGWTLQEERLSPRMLYVSSNRVYWSCAKSHELEMKPTYNNASISHRPIYAESDRANEMPFSQEFLLACYEGSSDLHLFWADIVEAYAKRSISVLSDRLPALAGVASRYLAATDDEYLAGLWSNHLAEGLAWRLHRVIEVDSEHSSTMPSWSWAVTPLETVLEMQRRSDRSLHFQRTQDAHDQQANTSITREERIQRGQKAKELRVSSRLRRFWGPASRLTQWSKVSKVIEGEERFTFAFDPEQDMHSIADETGRVLVYEGRKRQVVGQLDVRSDVEKVQSGQSEIYALELGTSTALLIVRCVDGRWRRVGVACDVRADFFSDAQAEDVVLR